MTCIVGVRSEGVCFLGADSLAMDRDYYVRYVRRDAKVFNLSPSVALGFTTSWRMGQILRDFLSEDVWKFARGLLDEYQWASRVFIPAARAALKEHGYLKVEENVEQGGEFLLAVGPRLFVIHSDLAIAENELPYAALGCGEQIALGALHEAIRFVRPSKALLERALIAAASHSAGVGRPFRYVRTSLDGAGVE